MEFSSEILINNKSLEDLVIWNSNLGMGNIIAKSQAANRKGLCRRGGEWRGFEYKRNRQCPLNSTVFCCFMNYWVQQQ